jgi:hypothetical protein
MSGMRFFSSRGWLRLGIVLGAILSAVAAPSFTASAATPHPVAGHLQTKTFTVTKTSRAGHIARVGSVHTETDPPGGGCTGTTQYDVTAYYFDNVLTDSVTNHYSDIVCDPLNPGEAMEHLTVLGELFIADRIKDRAPLEECNVCNAPPASFKTAYCAQIAEVCQGEYLTQETVSMLLPDGWYWTEPPWDDCTMTGANPDEPVEAFCFVESSPTDIPLFYM